MKIVYDADKNADRHTGRKKIAENHGQRLDPRRLVFVTNNVRIAVYKRNVLWWKASSPSALFSFSFTFF